ncbi:lipoprotein [Actinomadura sp. NBRC 104425]|nr:lipoprotein [Actinomadura sp. NBRC 104425]
MLGTTVRAARLVGAAALAAVAAGVLAGCGGTPPKAGAAALVGDERITTATLDGAVRDWQAQFRADPVANQMRAYPGDSDQQLAAEALSESDMRGALNMLVKIRVADEVARRNGLAITEGTVDRTIAALDRQGGARSVTLAYGLPARYTRDLARYLTVQDQLAVRLGADPADPRGPRTTTAMQGVVDRFVRTAADMDIKINPRFGTFDPRQVAIQPMRQRLSATDSGTA